MINFLKKDTMVVNIIKSYDTKMKKAYDVFKNNPAKLP